MSIGNIRRVNYRLIKDSKSFTGEDLAPNTQSYSDLVDRITTSIKEIGDDCSGYFDAVEDDEINAANERIPIIFNAFSQALVNFKDKVAKTTTADELRKVSTEFNDQFIFHVKFEATETVPGFRYISGADLGPFDVHSWFNDAKNKDSIKDDNGSYKLIGQLVDRVYGMFTTTLSASKDIITNKNEALKGKGGNVTPQPAKPGETPVQPKPGENPAKTLDQKIRSLVTQKNRLAQRQASLIKTIRALTSEARTLYVRQFLNEDGATPAKGSAAKTPATKTSEKQPPAKTKDVDSNDPLYIGLTELINTKNRIEAYYNTSKNYFKNNIAKRAKYLQSLMSGELKSNMSAEDRIKVLNNHNYDYDSTDTKGANDTPNATTTSTASVTTPVSPSSDATNQGTTPTQTPTIPVQPTTPNPIRATLATDPPPTNPGPTPVPVTQKTK